MITRTILRLALGLAAISATTATAIAEAAPAHTQHQRAAVGRIASISGTSVTVGDATFVLTARQLTGLSVGQCVEVESRARQGVVSRSRITREDRCAPVAAAATAPVIGATAPQHDVGDDHADAGHGRLGSDD